MTVLLVAVALLVAAYLLAPLVRAGRAPGS
jgi:hypothetical protein